MDGIEKGVVKHVWHSSLQAEKEGWVGKQMEGGWNACFSFMVRGFLHNFLITNELLMGVCVCVLGR